MSSRLRNGLPGKPLDWQYNGSGVLERVCLRDAGTETLEETEEEVWHGGLRSIGLLGLQALFTLPEYVSERSESVKESRRVEKSL